MLDFVNDYFSTLTASSAMFTRSKTRAYQQLRPLGPTSSIPQNQPRTVRERRGRKRDFNIFVESNVEDVSSGRASARRRGGTNEGDVGNMSPRPESSVPRVNGRRPLSIRSDSANSTPAPSPRLPGTPYPLSPADPLWFDRENWDPAPATRSPSTSATEQVNVTTDAGPPPPPTQSPRVIRTSRSNGLRPPRSMALYALLGLGDWKATRGDILGAWRQTALVVHPDRAPEQDREAATQLMQKVNAAKDVLVSTRRRRRYHEDGVLPWAV